MATELAAAGLSYQQVDAQLDTLAERLRTPLADEFAHLGIELTDFRLSGTLFDAATQQRIGRVADVAADTQAAAAAGLSYAELEKLKALREAARNAGGLAGAGMQLGAGAELGRLLASQPSPTVTPPPTLPSSSRNSTNCLTPAYSRPRNLPPRRKRGWTNGSKPLTNLSDYLVASSYLI